MSTPILTRTEKGQLCPFVPRYDERSVQVLIRFLAAYLTEVQATLDKLIAFAGPQRNHPLFKGQIEHWQKYVSCIKWLAHRVHCKQEHLLILTDDDIKEIETQWAETSET